MIIGGEYKPDFRTVKSEAARLKSIFGDLAPLVCDELLNTVKTGYDYDALHDVPLYNAIKYEIEKT